MAIVLGAPQLPDQLQKALAPDRVQLAACLEKTGKGMIETTAASFPGIRYHGSHGPSSS